MSTFSGIVSEISNISIDRFDGLNLMSTAYFLSHCHEDHMQGLYNKQFLNRLQEENIYLYCSEISYYILMNTCVKSVRDSLRVVSFQMEVIIEVPPTESHPKLQSVTVTAIPAGHCPGSIMFLFECVDGRILYTGDIRLLEGDIKKMKQLLNCDGNVKPVKTLYLDTTFLHPSYSYFPCREACATILCKLISEWIKNSSEHYVHITTPAKHGSEFLFVEIFKNLKVKVHVNFQHFELYRNVPEVEPVITASAALTQIHACGKQPCSFLTEKKKNGLVRVIKPSAMWFYGGSKKDEIWCQSGDNRFKVAYSCHSSLNELTNIIDFLKPTKIFPCVVPPKSNHEKVMSILRNIQQSDKGENFAGCKAKPPLNWEFTKLLSKESASIISSPSNLKDNLSSPPRKSSRLK